MLGNPSSADTARVVAEPRPGGTFSLGTHIDPPMFAHTAVGARPIATIQFNFTELMALFLSPLASGKLMETLGDQIVETLKARFTTDDLLEMVTGDDPHEKLSRAVVDAFTLVAASQ